MVQKEVQGVLGLGLGTDQESPYGGCVGGRPPHAHLFHVLDLKQHIETSTRTRRNKHVEHSVWHTSLGWRRGWILGCTRVTLIADSSPGPTGVYVTAEDSPG